MLLECAEYTVPEDCSMGLSYLLTLNDDYLMDAIDLFKNFPQTEPYYQILAYFCSVKLYAKINPDLDDVFFYDPVELIKHMSKAEIAANDLYMIKLKEEINNLIKNKQHKSDEISKPEVSNTTVDKFSNLSGSERNSANEELITDETLNDWDDWGEELNIEAKILSPVSEKRPDDKFSTNEKLTSDLIDESLNWGDWDKESSTEANEACSNSVLEKITSDKFEVSEKLDIDKIETAGEWGGWGDETMESFSEIASQLEKNSSATFKVYKKPSVDIINASGDWGDWDTETKVVIKDVPINEIERNSNSKLKSNENFTSKLVSTLENDWNDWSNDWDESNTPQTDRTFKDSAGLSDYSLCSDVSIEKRYKIFEEEFSKIQNIEQFKGVKQMLLQWPEIKNLSSDGDADSNVVLKMITKAVNISKNNEEDVFREIKDLVHEEMISGDVCIFFFLLKLKRRSY